MKEAKLKSTRIPYLLYFMRSDKAKIVQEDNGELNIYFDGQKVAYEKIDKPFIFLLKHAVPLWFAYLFLDVSIFQAVNNWFVPFVVLSVIEPVFYLYMYKSHYMLFYFAGIGVLMYYVAVYGGDIVFDVNNSFSVVTLLIYVGYLTFDIYLTYTKFGYYYLKNVTTNIQVTKGHSYLTVGFWKLKKTFYFSKKPQRTFNIGLIGTFVKVPNDIEWSEK